ncbi:DNA repair RAD52-like protein 2, chloroplastic [Malania oleifera]|uniref:DNA repair RAD52-like protein 2, chloroplastic n=1 Tax=Malania oleifera TaxID=397392 RepID=UPI0025AEA018|nr:DNA repair RAD52-like protein 2, chloroplastic [Malania oleifera]
MAFQDASFVTKFVSPVTEARLKTASASSRSSFSFPARVRLTGTGLGGGGCLVLRVLAVVDHNNGGGSGSGVGSGSSSNGNGKDAKKVAAVSNSNYVVPLDKPSSCITRPLAEILRDLNKRIPDNIRRPQHSTFIPWYHANRMLSFYAPGWCGEVRDVILSDTGSVTVVYRVTIRGSDGEAHRESSGTISSSDAQHIVDPVAAAEEIAFCRACARFGLGLYLYHKE